MSSISKVAAALAVMATFSSFVDASPVNSQEVLADRAVLASGPSSYYNHTGFNYTAYIPTVSPRGLDSDLCEIQCEQDCPVYHPDWKCKDTCHNLCEINPSFLQARDLDDALLDACTLACRQDLPDRKCHDACQHTCKEKNPPSFTSLLAPKPVDPSDDIVTTIPFETLNDALRLMWNACQGLTITTASAETTATTVAKQDLVVTASDYITSTTTVAKRDALVLTTSYSTTSSAVTSEIVSSISSESTSTFSSESTSTMTSQSTSTMTSASAASSPIVLDISSSTGYSSAPMTTAVVISTVSTSSATTTSADPSTTTVTPTASTTTSTLVPTTTSTSSTSSIPLVVVTETADPIVVVVGASTLSSVSTGSSTSTVVSTSIATTTVTPRSSACDNIQPCLDGISLTCNSGDIMCQCEMAQLRSDCLISCSQDANFNNFKTQVDNVCRQTSGIGKPSRTTTISGAASTDVLVFDKANNELSAVRHMNGGASLSVSALGGLLTVTAGVLALAL